MSDSAASPGAIRLVEIEIAKDYFTFAAAHFTIFSRTSRERLHGHSFRVRAKIVAKVDANGLMFDYGPLKRRIKSLCDEHDEYLLLPEHSSFLTIQAVAGIANISFNKKFMSIPMDEVKILPVRNVTVEELSAYFLDRLINSLELQRAEIERLCVGVSSGLGQWGTSVWRRQ